MKISRRKYVDVVQNRKCYTVIFVPTGTALGHFVTSPQASVARNAELIANIGKLIKIFINTSELFAFAL